MNARNLIKLKNKLLIKYYMIKAGNDSKKIKEELNEIVEKLRNLS